MVTDTAGLHHQKEHTLSLKLQLGVLGCATQTGGDLGLGPSFAVVSPTFARWWPVPKFLR